MVGLASGYTINDLCKAMPNMSRAALLYWAFKFSGRTPKGGKRT